MTKVRINARRLAAVAIAIGLAATSASARQKAAAAKTAPESLAARAKRVQREAIVIDTHIDTTGHIERKDWSFAERHESSDGHVDLPRMKEGGVTGAFF